MKVLVLLQLLVLLVVNGYSQNNIKVNLNQTVVLNYEEYIIYAHILSTENKVKPDDDLFYYWYNANDIKTTRGGFDGKLLHGVYTEFYINKNLKEKGEFKYGLKHGEWKSWYMNGQYKTAEKWKKGVKDGKFKTYNEKGEVLLVEEFKNGKLKDVDKKKLNLKKEDSKREKPPKSKKEKATTKKKKSQDPENNQPPVQ